MSGKGRGIKVKRTVHTNLPVRLKTEEELEEGRARDREIWRRRVERAKAFRICVDCGKPPTVKGTLRCKACAELEKAKEARKRARSKPECVPGHLDGNLRGGSE